MLVAIVSSLRFGEWPVTEVWYMDGSNLMGWSYRNEKISAGKKDDKWGNIYDVVRTRNREVSQAALIHVGSEKQAKELLGKPYDPEGSKPTL